MIQFAMLESVDKPMDRIEINYRALLAVAVVLNSQRDMHSLWEAITAEITKVVPYWAQTAERSGTRGDGRGNSVGDAFQLDLRLLGYCVLILWSPESLLHFVQEGQYRSVMSDIELLAL